MGVAVSSKRFCLKRQASLEAGWEIRTFWALSGEPIAVFTCRPTDPVAFLRRALEEQMGERGPWRLLLGRRVLGNCERMVDAGLGDGSFVGVVRCRPALVVTASDDGTAKLWSSASGECLWSLEGHGGRYVRIAAFSLDGELVVTASLDWTAKLWSSASGECLRSLEGHHESVRSAAFSSDGELVVTASDDGTARLWRSASGEYLRSLEGHGGCVRSAAFSPV